MQEAFAGKLDKATVTACCAAAGRGVAGYPSGVVGPDDDAAAVALIDCVGAQFDVCGDTGEFGILDVRILALVIAANTQLTAALLAGNVNFGLIGQGHVAAEDIDLPTLITCGFDTRLACESGFARRFQNNAPTFVDRSIGRQAAAVLDQAGSKADAARVCNDGAEVAHAFAVGINFNAHARCGAFEDVHRLASGKMGFALGGLDQAVVVHRGADQINEAATRGADCAVVLDLAGQW